jgi:hypothetical protein
MKIPLLTLLLLFSLCTCALAQKDMREPDFRDSVPQLQLYKTKPIIELPLTAVGFYFSQEKIKDFRDKAVLTGTLPTLTNNDVPGIDRWALRQNPDRVVHNTKLSDGFLFSAQLVPFTLFAWKKYRTDWLDITTMYFEAQALQGIIYGYAPFGPSGSDRLRPRVYYDEVDDSDRRGGNAQNSLFSGHVSTTATGWYFCAKIITDYNPDLTGGQKALIYGAATVPGVITAVLRIKALKHFPTDTAVGLGVGAFSGIMVPEFHRWWQKRHTRSMATITPLYGDGAGGLGFSLVF